MDVFDFENILTITDTFHPLEITLNHLSGLGIGHAVLCQDLVFCMLFSSWCMVLYLFLINNCKVVFSPSVLYYA